MPMELAGLQYQHAKSLHTSHLPKNIAGKVERQQDELAVVRQQNQKYYDRQQHWICQKTQQVKVTHRIASFSSMKRPKPCTPSPNDRIQSILLAKNIINIPLQLQHLESMGAMCVSKEERLQNQNRIRKAQEQARARRHELQNCTYAQKVRKYYQFYGRPVSEEMRKFVKENYSQSYNSEVRPPGYPRYGQLTLTYKDRVIDRFETANKNGTYARSLEFTKLEGNTIYYTFATSKATFDCSATFDSEDKFYRVYFNQRYVYTPPPPIAPQPQPKTNYYEEPQSNNYYGPQKDWGAHYAAELARSNQQFRENMNRQAQDWNNYVTQKANRGW